MISWIDFHDFFEINRGLYGESRLSSEQATVLGTLLTLIGPGSATATSVPESSTSH
jgi:hypothetical protein